MLTFGAGSLSPQGPPVHGGTGLAASLVSTHWMPGAPTKCHNQKCLQPWLGVPRSGGTSSQVRKHWAKPFGVSVETRPLGPPRTIDSAREVGLLMVTELLPFARHASRQGLPVPHSLAFHLHLRRSWCECQSGFGKLQK